MTAEADTPEGAPQKRSKLPLLVGLVLALVGGAGGFYATQSGLLGGKGPAAETPKVEGPAVPDVYFVGLSPLVISVPTATGRTHLRFAAQLQVAPGSEAAVAALEPRIVDVLNVYLRAVDIETLEDPTALNRLRAQMLRRVQIVTGPDQVSDLLIMEFVLS